MPKRKAKPAPRYAEQPAVVAILATIAARLLAFASMTLASTANPSPLTRPITIAAMTMRPKIWRR